MVIDASAPVPNQRSMRQGANVAIQLLDSVGPLLGLVPVPGLQVVWKGFKGLWDIIQQVHEGRSQLEVLSGLIAIFLRALDQKLRDNESLAASIEENLESLLSLIEEISEFARGQANKPFLKRLLQGDEVTATVTKYHHRLLHVYNVFNLSCELDTKLWQSQFEDARRHDQEVLEQLLQELLKNQDKLFKELFGKIDVQQTSILAAMSAMQKTIIRLNTQSDRSTERHFLQHSVALLQRRSGHVVKTESWTASSFEIDKGEKLGCGGFSTVYKATYLGAPVAIKELPPTTSSKMLMNEVTVSRFIDKVNNIEHSTSVMPLTALSVVSTNGKLFSNAASYFGIAYQPLFISADLSKLRLYYQDSDSTVREQLLNGEVWTPGFKFPIITPRTTRIATVSWNDQAEIRLFIQDHMMDIIEWAYHSSTGWESTKFRTPALAFTDIAATTIILKDKPHIWLYFHSPNGTLQRRICLEDNGAMKWTDAEDVLYSDS